MRPMNVGWWSRLPTVARRSTKRARWSYASFKPWAERLEDRTLLSTTPLTPDASTIVVWVGGSGDWSTPSNWSTGKVPGASDNVTISVPDDITVTHQSGNDTVLSLHSDEAFT